MPKSEYDPAGHAVQDEVMPVPKSENDPAGHAVQDEVMPVPKSENDPAGHAVQDEVVPVPKSENDPAGQAVQLAWFTWSVKVPAAQLTQTALAVDVHACRKVPAAQDRVAVQAVHVGFAFAPV